MKTNTENTAQHTPGPWDFETKGSRHFIDGSDGLTVAVLDREGVRNNRKENEANARLISAAPELLEALRKCVFDLERTIKHNSDPSNVRTVSDAVLDGLLCHADKARDAIAKATGEGKQ